MGINSGIGLLEGMITPIEQLIIKILGVVVEFIIGVIHGAISALLSLFTKEFLINEEMFESTMVNSIFQWSKDTLVPMAVALMLLIAMWQIFKTFFSFTGLNVEIEEPWRIGLKVMLFSILILYSVDICKYLVANPISKVMELLFNTNIDVTSGKISGITYGKDIFEALDPTNYVSFSNKNLCVIIVSAIIVIYIDWQMLNFILQIAQKYVNMIIYIAISPIAFAFGVSRATQDTFKGWTKLFAGGVAIQAMQIIMLQLINVYSRLLSNTNGKNWSILFIYMSIGIVLGKIEEILGDLGLPGGPKFELGIMSTFWNIWDIGSAALTAKALSKKKKGGT